MLSPIPLLFQGACPFVWHILVAWATHKTRGKFYPCQWPSQSLCRVSLQHPKLLAQIEIIQSLLPKSEKQRKGKRKEEKRSQEEGKGERETKGDERQRK
ncbi:uncharacterized protein B0T15DRAFT_543297 [Chaetomium strumarium]|uniref:Uncharacterized protein n=1 Tax=Chaetomium strumarium TaxID=1170767 RepID=A0AAJ0GMR6_9PEZI|nr:hypothetical protein B0T15DRAFT_543297 [Chaetomium strumarium]